MLLFSNTVYYNKTVILSDKNIKSAQEKGAIEIDPFEEKQVQPASYDLRVGAQGATIKQKEIGGNPFQAGKVDYVGNGSGVCGFGRCGCLRRIVAGLNRGNLKFLTDC